MPEFKTFDLRSTPSEARGNPLVRLRLRAQPVDATPSNELTPQYFPLESRSIRLQSIRPSQSGVPFESTLVNDFWLLSLLQVNSELVLRRPIETAAFTRT
jgi:hypothetical protein